MISTDLQKLLKSSKERVRCAEAPLHRRRTFFGRWGDVGPVDE